MDQEAKGYLLQIIENGTIVAEAPLLIHNAEATWRLFSENFGMLAHIITGGIYNTVRAACHEDVLKQAGPQVAIRLESKPTVPELAIVRNGNIPTQ